MSRLVLLALLPAALLNAQPDLIMKITGPSVPALAVPDFRGDSTTQPLMAAFNQTLWNDLDDSGFFHMVPKTHYPAAIPQQPSEMRSTGDWSGPPTQADYAAIGYSAVQNGVLMLRGWLLDVRGVRAAQVFEKRYGQSVDREGARQAAHQFAADILANVGAVSLLGTHICYVHESRPAPDRQTEIWRMDADGANQQRLVSGSAIFTQPAISPDGTRVAYVRVGKPGLFLYSIDLPHLLLFHYSEDATAIASPMFTSDGRQLLFAQSLKGRGMQLFSADLDGGNPRSLTSPDSISVEPKLNPKNGAQLAFASSRSGKEQVYTMSLDGTARERVSAGTGEASNPSWHPNGQALAFAWTQGYAPGSWNIFVIVVASGETLQLTHGEGKNENPVWAPDGRHIVFMSDRSGRPQIWSMLADGTHLHQLTTVGSNSTPTWGK